MSPASMEIDRKSLEKEEGGKKLMVELATHSDRDRQTDELTNRQTDVLHHAWVFVKKRETSLLPSRPSISRY